MSPFDLDVDTVDERTARALLTVISPPGPAAVTGAWVSARGPIEALRLALGSERVDMHELWEVDYWRTTIRERVTQLGVADAFSAACEPDARVLIPSDPQWPTGLDDLGHWAPVALWAEGSTDLLAAPYTDRVAIVGRQAATEYGLVVAQQLAGKLSDRGLQVVSGGAHGIDTEAHRGAFVAGGATIIVMAGSLETPFPPSNMDLFHRIRDNGGVLLTETPPGILASNTGARARHRITAALSGGVVAIEARDRSDIPDACEEALALGRPLGAVPGPVTSATSAASNGLVARGQAVLVANADDVTRMLRHSARSEAQHDASARSQRPSPPHDPPL
ncbi:DNA-processing protein DprA [Promicromonospora sp. NPDC023987]|uniref:DNA-processing protein DprA n=1 Tax=Promicromonospora sp. NPDC023987 TaxID=3155360 RepID=UPI0033D2AFC6